MGHTESKHKKSVAEYFNSDYQYWYNLYKERPKDELVNYLMRKRKLIIINYIDKIFNGNKNISVLDVGCGTGIYLKELINRGFNTFGVDIARMMIEKGLQNLKDEEKVKVKILIADAEELPFREESFDLIIAAGLLEYLPDNKKALSGFEKLLKKNGILIFTIPNLIKIQYFFDPYYYIVRIFAYLKHFLINTKKSPQTSARDFAHNTNFTNKRYLRKDIRILLKNTRFEELEVKALGYGPFTIFQRQFIPFRIGIKLSDFIENLSQKKSLNFIDNLASRWVVVTQKK